MPNLVPYNLQHSIERLRNNLTHTLERWGAKWRDRDGDLVSTGDWDRDFWSPSLLISGSPIVDVSEDEKEIRVTVELPGVDKDDFKVEVLGRRLTIQGEKKSSRTGKGHHTHYAECRYGSFSRSIVLPTEVESEKAKARYRNGVLKMVLPKTDAARAQYVQVKVQ